MSLYNSTEYLTPEFTKADAVHMLLLIERLSPLLTFEDFPVGKKFSFTPQHCHDCYIVLTGAISLTRNPNDVLIELVEAPTLRGIIPLLHSSQSSYTLTVIAPAQIAILKLDRFYALLTDLNLWEAFARHLQVMASRGADMLSKLILPTVYDLVRTQLYELMDKNEDIRESISAEKYIRSKTCVSRSAVMRILSDLRTGGYIVIENGVLKTINNIPKGY
ncbi:winged helix-turn-helix transcriptional regulator [Rahnella selenatireducens]|uniref:winged helix-turn-helix transcriptional regulator n=1 Tax=Rahnella selenatireducens TaxID=3389797 RepID=UPI003969AF31